VQVFHSEDTRVTLRLVPDEVPEERKGLRLALWWAELRQTLRLYRDVQEVEHQRHALVRGAVCLLQTVVNFGGDRIARLSCSNPTELAHHVRHRPIRRGTAVGQTVSLDIPHLAPSQTAAEFRQQPRLAHAGVPHDRDDLPLARHRCVKSLLQQRQLPRPAYEGTAHSRAMADDSRTLVGHTPDTVYRHWRLGRTERDLPLRLYPYVLLHQAPRGCTEENRARCRELSQPHGPLRGLPCGRVEPLRFPSQAVHHHAACVQPQTQGQGPLWRLPEVWSGGTQMLVQCKRRQDRPQGVILLRHRRTKQRQEAIAAEFDEAARIALHDLLDGCEHRLHEPLHRLGAQTHRQGRGIRQAATKHRHLFVFPSERERRRAALRSEAMGFCWHRGERNRRRAGGAASSRRWQR
jgi:hypothetical protein